MSIHSSIKVINFQLLEMALGGRRSQICSRCRWRWRCETHRLHGFRDR